MRARGYIARSRRDMSLNPSTQSNLSRAERAHQLFDEAVELPCDQRAAFVAQSCRDDERLREEVESLLAAHEQVAALPDHPTIGISGETFGSVTDLGDRIGQYTLQRVLGEGSYGIVYLGKQDPPLCRDVAIKVLRAGLDTQEVISRFEQERQALAKLDHPNIAKIFDAGSTATRRPYFVMEAVDGTPITRFCKDNNLPIETKLQLMMTVCVAVSHAHRRGILHRDLKPGNILVSFRDDKPEPTIIDFGIAKAILSDGKANPDAALTVDSTQLRFMGTPQYMSPEQASSQGNVGPQSDVYGLGAVLYELLTGDPPLQIDRSNFDLLQLPQLLQQYEPVLPSRACQKHMGDLDWVVMKALAKDPHDRYETPDLLADDLGHYLANEPVIARPPSRLYRLKKFARRHRRALSLAAACLALGALVSVIAQHSAVSPLVELAPTIPLQAGLDANFYQDLQFQHPVTSRTDSQVHFHWSRGVAPAPGVQTPVYAVRWTGVLVAPPEGIEAMGVRADDGARLRIDDRPVVWFQAPARKMQQHAIAPGRHKILLEYWNKSSLGYVDLLWQLPAHNRELVPADALFHAVNAEPSENSDQTQEKFGGSLPESAH
jgi:serine/threonine protein kinase